MLKERAESRFLLSAQWFMERVFQSCSRRTLLRSLAAGSSLLLPGILQTVLSDEARGATAPIDPLAPKPPQFPARAKRVIFMNMSGGVSHLDTFDPKPRLYADGGKLSSNRPGARPFLAPFWKFQRGGKCGAEVSDLFPNVRECMDDICLIRSMHGDHNDHFQATLGIHTGSVTFARPSIGSWVSYGLGTMNQNLPSFVVLAPYLPYAGSQVWSSDFLPGCHQGTRVLAGDEPIPDLKRRSVSPEIQEMELGLLAKFNRRHQLGRRSSLLLGRHVAHHHGTMLQERLQITRLAVGDPG